jgi:hypothetical protein
MVCHAYADRVECHADGKPVTIAPALDDSTDRITFLCALHEELVEHLHRRKVTHVAIEYQRLGMGKKSVNRHIGEVTGAIVGAAIHAGASVERA